MFNHRAPLDGSGGLLDAGGVNAVAAVELASARTLKGRALPVVALRPLLVVVTRHTHTEGRSRVAGIDRHFLKPIDPSDLRAALRAARSRHAA